jgi:putative membrane protein
MKRTIQGLLLAGSLVVGGSALAQSTTQGAASGSTQGTGSGQGATQGSAQGQMMKGAQAGKGMAKGGMIEHMGFMIPADEKAMLERLHHVNQMEIQLGELAQKNGQSQDVKSYGEMLVKDHTAADQKVKDQAKQKGLTLSAPKPLNEVERKTMAAQKANMEKLKELKGAPFDACFLANMVGDHDEVLGKLMAAQQNVTDTAMTPLLQDLSRSIMQHRQQAHTLLSRVGPGSTTGVGGAGMGGQGMGHDMGHGKGTGTSGTGSTGTTGSGTQGTGSPNTMDPGNTKKF